MRPGALAQTLQGDWVTLGSSLTFPSLRTSWACYKD